ncbi:hypothetical protein BGX30_001513 [Mortierella sp. GBA39]|nr:hypothetical protein BGX30_001513 [Mortierella sp. GBA39]
MVTAATTNAAPVQLQKRLACQIGSIWGGGDAACSASCVLKGQGFHGGHCSKNAMFKTYIFLAMLTVATTANALTCQLGGIFFASDAACSASCIAQNQELHGGHCNDKQVCICNY